MKEDPLNREGGVTDEQNEQGLEPNSEVSYSLANDSAYMGNAISMNEYLGSHTSPRVNYTSFRSGATVIRGAATPVRPLQLTNRDLHSLHSGVTSGSNLQLL